MLHSSTRTLTSVTPAPVRTAVPTKVTWSLSWACRWVTTSNQSTTTGHSVSACTHHSAWSPTTRTTLPAVTSAARVKLESSPCNRLSATPSTTRSPSVSARPSTASTAPWNRICRSPRPRQTARSRSKVTTLRWATTSAFWFKPPTARVSA
ncbi:hypothetical protein D3C75_914630 [compost metagenome]